MEIFWRLLRNRINKTNTDEVKNEVLIQHYQRLGEIKTPAGPPTSKGPKQIHPIYSSLEKNLKSEGRDYNQKPDVQYLGTVLMQINQNKD